MAITGYASVDTECAGLGASLQTSSHGRTDRGAVRSHNEDAFLADGARGLWAVADGMGGHDAGDIASQAVVASLGKADRPAEAVAYVDVIDDAVEAVNTSLINYAAEHRLKLVGTTVALLLDAGGYMLCAWAGDSRVYKLDGLGLRQITTDHSEPSNPVATGQFSAAQLQSPHTGALLRAVGAVSELVMEWVAVEAARGDVFLLCSDGITKELPDDDIAAILARPVSPGDCAETLIENCLARGARDNCTAVVVRVDG